MCLWHRQQAMTQRASLGKHVSSKSLSVLRTCPSSTCSCNSIWVLWLGNGWNFSTWPFYSLKDKLFFVLLQIFHLLLRFCQWKSSFTFRIFTLSSEAHSGDCQELGMRSSNSAASGALGFVTSYFCSFSWSCHNLIKESEEVAWVLGFCLISMLCLPLRKCH